MKACKVEIVTSTQGNRSRFAASGAISEREDGFHLICTDEGDELSLELCGAALLVSRHGSRTMHARFQNGKNGEARLGIGGAEGNLPFCTTKLLPRRTQDGWRIALQYTFFSEDVQRFHLLIAVNIISEEQ